MAETILTVAFAVLDVLAGGVTLELVPVTLSATVYVFVVANGCDNVAVPIRPASAVTSAAVPLSCGAVAGLVVVPSPQLTSAAWVVLVPTST